MYKSVASTVSKTVSKVSGGSSSKSSSTNSKSSSSGNKTSTTATSKTVSSNVSSANKQSTTTKYVTNAAAIYNASGKKVSTPSSVSTGRPAQSYATQAKTSTTNSQKSTVSFATVKTTPAKAKTVTSTLVKSTSTKTPNSKSPLSISSGRPEQSYSTQKKASTTYNQKTTDNSSKQAKLPVPVAQKAPLVTKTSKSKKEQSEASYSNNRPKQSYTHVVAYTQTASREGAGQMFYTTKTDPKALKAGASFATSCIPYVGDAKDIQQAVTGKDLITGEKLSGVDRVLTITAAGLPVVSGPMLKSVKNGGKIAVEKAPGVIKKAGTLIKKNAPKVKKVTNKTDVAEDTAKAMKKKAVKKLKKENQKDISNKIDYREVFFNENPKLKGQVWVHHGVEQQVLVKPQTKGLFTYDEIHSIENLRGIPNELNGDLHLSKIRKEWNRFYKEVPNPKKKQLLDKRAEIDNKYGHLFNPPIK